MSPLTTTIFTATGCSNDPEATCVVGRKKAFSHSHQPISIKLLDGRYSYWLFLKGPE